MIWRINANASLNIDYNFINLLTVIYRDLQWFAFITTQIFIAFQILNYYYIRNVLIIELQRLIESFLLIAFKHAKNSSG